MDKYMYFPSALFLIYYFKFLSKPFKRAQKKTFSNVVGGVSNHWKAYNFPLYAACAREYIFTALIPVWRLNFFLHKLLIRKEIKSTQI